MSVSGVYSIMDMVDFVLKNDILMPRMTINLAGCYSWVWTAIQSSISAGPNGIFLCLL